MSSALVPTWVSRDIFRHFESQGFHYGENFLVNLWQIAVEIENLVIIEMEVTLSEVSAEA